MVALVDSMGVLRGRVALAIFFRFWTISKVEMVTSTFHVCVTQMYQVGALKDVEEEAATLESSRGVAISRAQGLEQVVQQQKSKVLQKDYILRSSPFMFTLISFLSFLGMFSFSSLPFLFSLIFSVS